MLQMLDLVDTVAANRDGRPTATGWMVDLASLDAQGLAISQMAGLPPVITSHPPYQYLGGGYGLEIAAVEWA